MFFFFFRSRVACSEKKKKLNCTNGVDMKAPAQQNSEEPWKRLSHMPGISVPTPPLCTAGHSTAQVPVVVKLCALAAAPFAEHLNTQSD